MIVLGIPDDLRGERLVLLHTLEDNQVRELNERISGSELPNLWRPRQNAFHRIESIPFLGTGKLDIRKAKQLALEYFGSSL